MARQTFLDVFNHVFEASPKEIAKNAERLPFEAIQRARGRYVDLTARLHNPSGDLKGLLAVPPPYGPPARQAGQFRAVVGPYNSLSAAFGSPGFASSNYDHLGDLKRNLLYAHQVVLPTPLEYILCVFGPGDREREITRTNRGLLKRFSKFLSAVQRPVAAGAVSFYSQYELFGMQGALEEAIRQDFPQDIEAPAVCCHAFHAARYGGSIVLDNPEMHQAFAKHMPSLPAPLNSQRADWEAKTTQRATMQTLASVELPSIDSLSLEDIVSAKQSTVYAKWAEGLEAAVRSIDSSGTSDLTRDLIAASLEPGAAAVHQELRRLDPARVLRDKAVPFGMGAVLLTAVGTGLPGLLAAGLTTTIGILYQLLKDKSSEDATLALSKHYAVWGKPDSANRRLEG